MDFLYLKKVKTNKINSFPKFILIDSSNFTCEIRQKINP